MTRNGWMVTALVAIVLVAAGYLFWSYSNSSTINNGTNGTNGGTPTSTAPTTTPVANGTQTLTLAGGEVSLSYDQDLYALAANASQVLVHPYIPPCDQGFNYCLYYNSNAYTRTNFESAGLRIAKRTDLGTERACLNTPPAGYAAATKPAGNASTTAYSASIFPTGDAAAGHYAMGDLYRLFVRASSACYEFETRIGETQYANYPSGTIEKFTDAERATVASSLRGILDSVTLTATNAHVNFPTAPAATSTAR